MDAIMNFFKSMFPGRENPFTSLTFWGLLIFFGIPPALEATTGIDASTITNVLGPILTVLGIRRKP